MNGLCECGCGQTTKVARWNDKTHGWVRGQHYRYVNGHQNRRDPRTLYRIEASTGCWIWTGTTSAGYGVITLQGKSHLAHRWFYERFHGVVPDTLDHLCRNRRCVNPEHIEPCSRGENVRRGDVAILTWDAVAEIRRDAARIQGSMRHASELLAGRYGVAAGTIRNVLMGKRWPESARPVG